MHDKPIRRILPPLVILGLIAAAVFYLLNVSGPEATDGLSASGTVEAVDVIVAPELAGRVAEVLVSEGDQVAVGDLLFRLEDDLLQAQRVQVTTHLETAQARLAQIRAGATPEDIAAAEAAVVAAKGSVAAAETALAQAQINAESARVVEETESAVDAAEAALAQAEATKAIAQAGLERAQAELARLRAGARPQEIAALQAQVNQAQSQFLYFESLHFDNFIDRGIGGGPEERSRYQREAARGARDAAQAQLDLARAGPSAQEIAVAVAAVHAAEAQVSFAQAGVEAAEAALHQAQAAPETSQAQVALADAGVAAAQVQVDIAKGQLARAEAQRDRLVAGATTEEEAVLQAQVDQAEAELGLIDLQIEKLVVRAAVSGVVLTRNVEPGEIVQPGAVAFTLGRLDDLTITVYVTEDRYGRIHLGDEALVHVDSFPGKAYRAEVIRIADRAEFTPRNVQTEEGRRTTVFAVELSVDNPVGDLKPGMPADVFFSE